MTQQECNIDKIIKYLYDLQIQLTDISPTKKATDKTNEQPSENIEEKRQSWWLCLRRNVKKIVKMKRQASSHGSHSGGSTQGGSKRNRQYVEEDQEDADLVIRKLQSDINQMMTAFINLSDFQTDMSKWLESDLPSTKLSAILQKTDSIRTRSHDLKEIRRKVLTLKCQIPSMLNNQSSKLSSITDSHTSKEIDEINETGNDIYLPGLHVSKDFKYSTAFEEVVEIFQGLDFLQKLCLLSFAVFPENREVEKTMLKYWWIGEGFIDCDDSENTVTSILDHFSTKRILEPVEDERKLKPRSYMMEPHVHSAVIHLATSGHLFKLYNPNGDLTMKKSSKEKVCLVKGSSLLPEAKASKMQPQNLTTVFNSSERYPDFTFKWFPLMKSLKVLYLGRWERTAKRHIEVESTKFLKDMKALKNLRLASFQGISRIEKLENSICALPELVILDLKACYNLEVLPSDIGLFEKLIYLDVSDCYMLDRMPKGIAKLSRLQVLKGFVISETDHENDCAVKHLLNLRKLSITVNKYTFKVENLMESLTGLKQLESLKIAWGARFPEDGQKREKTEETNEADDHMIQEKRSPPPELSDMLQKKPDDEEKTDQDEGKKREEVEATKSKSDKVVEGNEKTRPPQETEDTIQNKTGDKTKVGKEGEGDKGKADPKEGTRHDEVDAGISKSDNVVDGVKKPSPSQDDHKENSKVQEKEGNKGNTDLDEGKKENEVKPESLKDTLQSKADDHTEISEVQDLKKLDGGEAKTEKSHKTIKFGKTESFSEKSKDLMQKKPDDLKNDNSLGEEIHETASPSRKSKSSKPKKFMTLGNQTMNWGRLYHKDQAIAETSKLPSSLKKLELECFPEKDPPSWLEPKNLDKLEKLSIKGGKLRRISKERSTAENQFSVQILRLKYLHDFKIEWKDLRAVFPKMILLEKYECPKIAFCPTDGNGVWRKPHISSPNM